MTVAETWQVAIGITAVFVAFLGVAVAGISLWFFVRPNNKLIGSQPFGLKAILL